MSVYRLTWSLVAVVALLGQAQSARAQETAVAEEPSRLLLRLGASVGGGYTTNLFLNASQTDDALGLAKLTFNGNWFPTDGISVKLSYAGDAELNEATTSQRHWGHNGDLTLGYRALDIIYTSLAVGGEQAYYLQRTGSTYSFWGLFGRAGARVEIGGSSTLRADYRFREDTFPNYDLDNQSHLGVVEWTQAIGDSTELRLPVTVEATYYRERFLIAADQSLTSDHRTGLRGLVEPGLTVMPSYDLRVGLSLGAEINSSNDTYYYVGPYGVADPTVTPSLVAHYDSYRAGFATVETRFDLADAATLTARCTGGQRLFDKRPAYDADGLDTGEKEVDTFVQPGVEANWRFSDVLGLSARYIYLRQWSNDALWQFDAHRVEVFLDAYAGN